MPASLRWAALAACGGDGGDEKTPTARASTASPQAQRTSGAGVTTTPGAGGATPAAGATNAPAATKPAGVPSPSGKTYSADDAKKIVGAALLGTADLPGAFTVATDTTSDNATAAATDPAGGASFERCGRLLGRTVVASANDLVNAFLGGETLTFFTTVTVYASHAGAADCAAEAGVRFQQPGQLARSFGSVFVNPDAVVVTPVDFPQVADGAFAATLTGEVNAQGTVVTITILVAGFRKGNVTAAVGSARNGIPPTSELQPLVNLVISRIAANQ